MSTRLAFVLTCCGSPLGCASASLVKPPANDAASAGASDIVKGSDGNMWFTEFTGDKIGVITPSGVMAEFPVPSSPYGITSGSDGNIWFTEPSAGKIARFVHP